MMFSFLLICSCGGFFWVVFVPPPPRAGVEGCCLVCFLSRKNQLAGKCGAAAWSLAAAQCIGPSSAGTVRLPGVGGWHMLPILPATPVQCRGQAGAFVICTFTCPPCSLWGESPCKGQQLLCCRLGAISLRIINAAIALHLSKLPNCCAAAKGVSKTEKPQ